MNKILMDGDKIILTENDNIITVNGRAKIYINNITDSFNLEINLKDDAILDIFDFQTNGLNKSIKVFQNNNSTCNYYHTFKISDEYNFKYRAVIDGNNNINTVNISGISNGKVLLDVDGKVMENTIDNELDENIRILTINGTACVYPMLHVSCQNVLANHNTAISNIQKDDLFYLMSKGIDKLHAQELIENGYLYGYLKQYDEEFYNMIK